MHCTELHPTNTANYIRACDRLLARNWFLEWAELDYAQYTKGNRQVTVWVPPNRF